MTGTKHQSTATNVHHARSRDRGSTFIELLVAIVLLGTVVVATLAGLRAAIVGSEIDEDSGRAHAWLQAASDEVYRTSYRNCNLFSAAQIDSAYQAAVDTATRPASWGTTSGAVIDIIDIRFLSVSGSTEAWGPHSTCATASPASPIYPQLVILEVRDPDGTFLAQLEVIKSV